MLNERGIKDSFDRVKEDIFNLSKEISSLKLDILDLKQLFSTLNEELSSLKLRQIYDKSSNDPTDTPTNDYQNPTDDDTPTHNPTVPQEIGGLKYPKTDTSMRNGGVPTDKQTNQQTDNPSNLMWNRGPVNADNPPKTLKQHILDATEILDSLDNLRKEVRLKFKAITNQEMLVFSTIYELEQTYSEGVEYDQIALKLKLSPSSIRDYVQRLLAKGVPILKTKVNNKKVFLKISNELKKIATLDTIIKLREL